MTRLHPLTCTTVVVAIVAVTILLPACRPQTPPSASTHRTNTSKEFTESREAVRSLNKELAASKAKIKELKKSLGDDRATAAQTISQLDYLRRIDRADRETLARNLTGAWTLLKACPDKLRDWEWKHLAGRCTRIVLTFDAQMSLNSVAFSPNGRAIAVAGIQTMGSISGNITVVETASGKTLHNLGQRGYAQYVVFSPDGHYLATAGESVTIWDANTGNKLREFTEHGNYVNRIAFSPDGRLIATADIDGNIGLDREKDEGEVKIWNPNTGSTTLTIDEGHRTVAFSPDGRRLVASGKGIDSNKLKVWDTTSGEELLTLAGHSKPIQDVDYSPDGKSIVSASSEVILWDASNGRRTQTFSWPAVSVRFSPNGQLFASAGGFEQTVFSFLDKDTERFIRIVDLTSHEDLKLDSYSSFIAFSLDSSFLADGSVAVWDIEDRMCRSLDGHTAPIASLAFRGNHTVVSSSQDNTQRSWNTFTQEQTSIREFPGVITSTVGPDGQPIVLVNNSENGSLVIQNAATGQPLLTIPDKNAEYVRLELSHDGKSVAVARVDDVIDIWDVKSGELQASFVGDNESAVTCLTFDVGATMLVSGRNDGTVTMSDVATGRELWRFENEGWAVKDVAFDPDVNHVCTVLTKGSVSKLTLWNSLSGAVSLSFDPCVAAVNYVAFAPQGQRLATAGADGSVRIWDTSTGRECLTLRSHTSEVLTLAFSADGHMLVTGGADGRIRLWTAGFSSGQGPGGPMRIPTYPPFF